LHKCNQDGIAKLLDVYDYDDTLYIFVEHLPKRLDDYVNDYHTRYDENIVRYVLRTILEAIDFLHNKGIVIRNLNSEHILFNEKGEVKLAEFGDAA
jgi:mitogen-activated protein kinase kinase kinase